ncbi:MAG TPA: phosphatase PAP2 family protein [Vicinamibacterales bacterium]|nr:phosphatase PAP2 family protein [Vicinamibacterales bacterium]
MPTWAAASTAYFVYLWGAAMARPGLPAPARLRATAACAAGLLLAALGAALPLFWLQSVVLPPIVLLVAYWAGGLLWVRPMPRVERFLVASDRALRVPEIASRTPRALVELQEIAYAGVYPLIPIALALHMVCTPAPDADRFWTVILVTDFICFGMLPWIQTRPPRLLDPAPPWRSSFRTFNVRLLGEASIGVNTVPSGHAAEALAAALLVSGAPWPILLWMWFNALAISAGAVLGRYHFALDAVAGWAVAAAVWAVLA